MPRLPPVTNTRLPRRSNPKAPAPLPSVPAMSSAENAFPQTRFAPPPGATDLLLVRHGESAPLPAAGQYPVIDGHADPELSPEGRVQAGLLADRLQRAGIDAIYTSTLRRTVQTAAPLAERIGVEPIIEPDLREVFLGEWEGGMFRKLEAERSPLTAEVWRSGSWDLVPGGEASDGFARRVRGAIERICSANPGRRVMVVAHGGVIGQVISSATGAAALAFVRCDNASISHLVVHGDLWIVRRFNDTAHLGPTFSATAAQGAAALADLTESEMHPKAMAHVPRAMIRYLIESPRDPRHDQRRLLPRCRSTTATTGSSATWSSWSTGCGSGAGSISSEGDSGRPSPSPPISPIRAGAGQRPGKGFVNSESCCWRDLNRLKM